MTEGRTWAGKTVVEMNLKLRAVVTMWARSEVGGRRMHPAKEFYFYLIRLECGLKKRIKL